MVARETSVRQGLEVLALGPLPEGAVERLEVFGGLLEEAIALGYLGPRERERIVGRHLLESCALLSLIGSEGSLVDVGSGAGLPGLALACVRTGMVTLVEAQRSRAEFLQRAATRLGVSVSVLWARAEDVGHGALRESFHAAVARALAPPPVALELTLPLVGIGGRVVLPVGTTANGVVEAAREACTCLGGSVPELVGLEVPGLAGARWVMIVQKLGPTPDRFPRRAGVPRRRPLGGGVKDVK